MKGHGETHERKSRNGGGSAERTHARKEGERQGGRQGSRNGTETRTVNECIAKDMGE